MSDSRRPCVGILRRPGAAEVSTRKGVATLLSFEDDDDDSDGVFDAADSCPKGSVSWVSNSSTDLDQDGCLDHSEDLDDDGDGVLDHLDSCSDGMTGWRSTSSTDLDGDGCRDVDEDEDDDGDSVPDVRDQCPRQLVTGPASAAQSQEDTALNGGAGGA